MASPMPELAPVTSAVVPARRAEGAASRWQGWRAGPVAGSCGGSWASGAGTSASSLEARSTVDGSVGGGVYCLRVFEQTFEHRPTADRVPDGASRTRPGGLPPDDVRASTLSRHRAGPPVRVVVGKRPPGPAAPSPPSPGTRGQRPLPARPSGGGPVSRLHTDAVEVQRHDDVPAQFLWRGRLYVVREVLARWTESGGWWRAAAVQSLSDGDGASGAARRRRRSRPRRCRRRPSGRSGPGASPRPTSTPRSALPASTTASRTGSASRPAPAGAAGTGVYDLCFSWSTGRWSLARVLD